jgi:tape measure domain-containing protein
MASTVSVDFNANLTRFSSAIDRATNDLSKFQSNAERISKNIGNTFKTFGSGFAVGAVFNQVTQISDSYTKLTAQLKNSTRSFAEFGQSFENVQRISASAQVDVEAIATTYARLSNALKDFGVSQKSIADVAETITLALKVNGATAEETASATLQLSQAFGSGKLQGDEFRAAMEAAPNLMRILAESMKVPVGSLNEMAKEGQITSEVLLKAFSDPKVLEGLREQAKQVKTISGGYTEIYNQIKLLVGETEKASGATSLYAKTLSGVASLIEKIRKGGGVDSGLLSFVPGGQAFGVFNEAGRLSRRDVDGASSSGTIRRIAPQTSNALGFDDLTKGLKLLSVELAKIRQQEDEAKKSFTAGKITAAQYKEIMAALAKEKQSLTKTTQSSTRAIKEEDIALQDFAARQQEVAGLIERAINLDAPSLSAAQSLQEELDAYTNLEPAVRNYIQGLIEISRAKETQQAFDDAYIDSIDREIEAFNEAADAQKTFEDSIADYAASLQRAIDPTIELADNVGKLQSALSLGIIDQEQYNEMVKFLEDEAKKHKETTDEITEFWREAARNIQDGFSDFFFDVMDGKLSDLAGSFTRTINRMVADLAAAQFSRYLFGDDFGKGGDIGGVVGNIFSGSIGEFFSGLFNANGNAFNQSGLIPFANGGIVSAATPFAFGGGRLGVMGEAGPEAILPLKRGPNGKLGVAGNSGVVIQGPLMVVNTPDANSFMHSDAQISKRMQQVINRAQRIR